HVGFYLVDKGLPRLEAATAMRVPVSLALQRSRAGAIYFGSIALMTAAFTGALLAQAHAGGARDWLLTLFGILALLAASQLAVALANWLATLLVAPRPLPRMDFSQGIAPG